MNDSSIRLNKFISDSGFCSRREADSLIDEGKVRLNDRVANTGMRVSQGDHVEVNGQVIKAKTKKETTYIAFNKPPGITCTSEQDVKGNIIDFLKFPTKIFPIGRLDKFSQGLIFLTNDGDIVNKILRAGNSHEKEYIVNTNRPITDTFIRKMSNGVHILGTVTQKCKVKQEGKYGFRITLTQGMNRQIRRMCEELGYKVTDLIRLRIMNVSLGKLKTGSWRHLTRSEMDEINKLVENSSNTQEASNQPRAKKQYVKKDYPRSKGSKSRGPSKGRPTKRDNSSRGKRSASQRREDQKTNGKPKSKRRR
jgi:23S rRNA pseudouridine2604 synthase